MVNEWGGSEGGREGGPDKNTSLAGQELKINDF